MVRTFTLLLLLLPTEGKEKYAAVTVWPLEVLSCYHMGCHHDEVVACRQGEDEPCG